jgi:hypothetical protein
MEAQWDPFYRMLLRCCCNCKCKWWNPSYIILIAYFNFNFNSFVMAAQLHLSLGSLFKLTGSRAARCWWHNTPQPGPQPHACPPNIPFSAVFRSTAGRCVSPKKTIAFSIAHQSKKQTWFLSIPRHTWRSMFQS